VGREKNVRVVISTRLSGTAIDQSGAYAYVPPQVLDRLNARGEEDGNTFTSGSGEGSLLILRFNIRGEGDRFAGSVDLSSPDGGALGTLETGAGTYANLPAVVSALTDRVYVYIRRDWHPPR